MEVPTRSELRKLKVVELRQKLSKASLPQGGVKEDLITRLLNHYESVAESEKEEALGKDEEEVEEEGKDVKGNEEEKVERGGKEMEGGGKDVKGDDEEKVEEGGKDVKGDEEKVEGGGKEREEVRGDEEREEEEEEEVRPEEAEMVEKEKKEEMEGTEEVKVEEGRREEAEEEKEGEVEKAREEEVEERGKEVEEERGGEVEEVRGEELEEKEKEMEKERGGEEMEGEGEERMEEEREEVEERRDEEVEERRDEEVEERRVEEVEERRGEEVEEARREEVEEARGEEVEMREEGMEEERREVLKEVRREPVREEEEGARGEVKRGEKTVRKHMEGGVEGEATGIRRQEKEEEKGKGKRKKKKKRRRRHNQQEQRAQEGATREPENEVEIEYVQEDILRPGDLHYRQFHQIFEAFKIVEPVKKPEVEETPMDLAARSIEAMKKIAQLRQQVEEESDEEEEEKEPPKISKKKLRKLNRLTVAQLKQLVDRPDVVEMHDVTAQDPKLLIHLKSTRNTVCVPRHWCFKRKYLQGKRGIEKPPFDLPDFIKATGVMEMRQALEEKEEQKSLKQKTRERVRPKMGKLTIDYQKLHDAFFKWQTKPKMSIHGDLYYEGKEFETRLKEKKPGDLSDELRRALGMPIGTGKNKFPPPWLVAMQRYGPPPSYPNLKIPGLNAPIPEGCSFGYFVGGWGKPPVDEMGRPLYGDVFGVDLQDVGTAMDEEEIDKSLWGELESEEEEEEEEEEESEEEGEAPKPDEIQAGLVTPVEGLVTPSGLTSIPAGLETPEMIQLRKKKIEEAMEQGGETPALYTVLPEKQASVGGAMMGSSHVYDITAAVPGAVKKASGAVTEGVEVALDPSELDFDTATMTARYEEQLREQQNQLQKEDLSDMVAEHAAKQKKRKRAAAPESGGKAAKKMKMKEFKF